MARYRVNERCYLSDKLLEAGDEIDLPDDVVPGPHMAPKDDAAKKAVKAAGARMTRSDPVDTMTGAQPDDDAVGTAVAKAVQAQAEAHAGAMAAAQAHIQEQTRMIASLQAQIAAATQPPALPPAAGGAAP